MAVLDTRELCDYIINFLHDSQEDLQLCARVSHPFIFPAQRNLFQEVSLMNPLTLRTKAATRLKEIMDVAPHLRHLVQRVSTAINVDILTQLTNLHLTHLNHLTLLNMSPGSIGIPALSVARDLLVLPSLHTLVIDASFPSCAASPALIKVLEAAPRIAVVCLHAHGITVGVGISLASFPTLTKLRLIGHPYKIEVALASLPHVRLQTLILASGTLTPSLALHVDALKQIDAQLAELHLPALARLEMSILPSSHMHPRHDLPAIEATHVAVTKACVCMGKCGVLVVRDFKVWD
ncbi:hypothetical protein C8R44DRAFT_873380 [Mycena epipterygia]|nr:hypothetical protein C8R44DRAFT_873380 [Mycena epipterygia]